MTRAIGGNGTASLSVVHGAAFLAFARPTVTAKQAAGMFRQRRVQGKRAWQM